MGFAYACDGVSASTTQRHSIFARVAIRRVDKSSCFILSLLAFFSDPRRGCYIVSRAFIFFFFFFFFLFFFRQDFVAAISLELSLVETPD